MCKILGLPNWNCLVNIICQRSSIVKKINPNKITFSEEEKILNLPLVKMDVADFDEINKKILVQIPSFNNCPGGWQAILQSNPQKCASVNIKYGVLEDTIRHIGVIDRGHLLADRFSDNIKIKIKNPLPNQSDNFFSKKNMNNILPQFCKANEGRKNGKSQKDFEEQVRDWLKIENSTVFYEIQPIFTDSNDTMPIGNRILAINLNTKAQFHVLVPNFYDEDKAPKLYHMSKIYRPLYSKIRIKPTYTGLNR